MIKKLKKIMNKLKKKMKKLKKQLKKKAEYKVSMFGLSDSGKTTILYLLHLGEKMTTIHTIGYKVEINHKLNWRKSIPIWDIGGQKKIRELWNQFLNDIYGLIQVYDISDNEIIEESQNE